MEKRRRVIRKSLVEKECIVETAVRHYRQHILAGLNFPTVQQ